jgi:hypothetical protein
MLINKTILIISPDKWSFLSLSKHNYAIELAKKNTVYYLEPSSKEVSKELFVDLSGVKVISHYKRMRGISKFPRFIGREMMRKEIDSILCQIKGDLDVVWSFDTSRLFYLDLFKAKKSIAHVVDFTEDFNLGKLVSSADLCLSVADSISEKISMFNNNVHKVNHGFIIKDTDATLSENTNDTNSLIGVYVGNLNMPYIDWESLLMLAEAHRNIHFNYFGPLSEKTIERNEFLRQLKSSSNVFFKGYLNTQDLSTELKKSSFCIVSYLHKEFGKQLDNSHKIMQYLGSGTPVFSSYTYEYRNDDLLCMFENREDMLSTFDRFMSEESIYFTKIHRKKRINYAHSNSYQNLVKKIEQLLEN